MDLSKVLEHLRWELEHLDSAIRSLEQLSQKGSLSPPEASSDSEPTRTRPRSTRVRALPIRKVPDKAE